MSIKYPLFVNELVEKFNLNVLINNEYISKIQIQTPSISRADFELTGENVYDSLLNITYFGTKEYLYLQKFNLDIVEQKIQNVLNLSPPLILLGPNFLYNDLIVELAKNTRIPIISVEQNLQTLHITIGNWVQEKLSSYILIHGSLISVFGVGTLIIGKSGIGKSEIIVELVKKGHIFVGDDAILVTRIGKRIFGKSSDTTKNFIEIRGLGILNFQKVFGIEKQIKSVRINAICELKDIDDLEDFNTLDRLGNKINYMSIEGIDIPHYCIPVSKSRNISDLIETAITDLKLKKQGYFSANDFINQIEKNKNK